MSSKVKTYREMQFSAETPHMPANNLKKMADAPFASSHFLDTCGGKCTARTFPLYADFYTYSDVKDLSAKFKAQKHDTIKCRTVGILLSQYGQFYLYDLESSGVQTECSIQVSVIYLNTPLKSTVPPYPVQVFGTLQWIDNKPTLFIKLLQVLTIPAAIRYKDILSTISKQHCAEK